MPAQRLCQLLSTVADTDTPGMDGGESCTTFYYFKDQKLVDGLDTLYRLSRKANLLAALRMVESKCLDDEDDLVAVAQAVIDAV